MKTLHTALIALTIACLGFAGCGEPPEEVSSKTSAVFGSCTGTTPEHMVDTYTGINFTGTCTRIPPYTQVGTFYGTYLWPYSIKVGPHTIIRYFTGDNFTGSVAATIPDSPSVQPFSNMTSWGLPNGPHSLAMLPIGYRSDGGGQSVCYSPNITTPGVKDLILFNGTSYGGVCAVFTGIYPNAYWIPDLSYFGWDPAHYPVASVKLGAYVSATGYQNVNFDSGGAPPLAFPAGWSFPQLTPFRSLIFQE